MANWLHYHPDAIIYIRDANDAIVYEATFDEFKHDYGQPFPTLPSGAAQLELLSDGELFIYDSKQNERDAFDIDRSHYQAVLEALPKLMEMKKRREPAALVQARVPRITTFRF